MTDLIVTPENTKLIADWMGKENIIIADDTVCFTPNGLHHKYPYNLIGDADQRFEVEKKLMKKCGFTFNHTYGFGKSNQWVAVSGNLKNFEAKELELVIYKAALSEAMK